MTDRNEYPNQTIKLLLERASCRKFSNQEIPSDVLQLVLEAGIQAATGGNLQPYSIIKIEDKETKRTLARKCEQGFIGRAPVLLLFCIDWHRIERWASLEAAPFTATSSFRHFWISFQDTVICAQSICTAADALGLGSVYIGTILEFFVEVWEMFQLPKGVFPVVLLCLGYPKTGPRPQKKLRANVIVHAEQYRELEDQELIDAFNEKYRGDRAHGDRRKITERRLKTISEVSRKVHGEEFAKKCVNRIKETGYMNPVQDYFGLHYRADLMPIGNDAYLEIMEEFGFNWFKEYHEPTES